MKKAKSNKKNKQKKQMGSQFQNTSKDQSALQNENNQFNLCDQYELNRENTLVSQSGLITAVFSFSTTALFTVWDIGLREFDRIPDRLIHISIGIITFVLLLSMLFAVLSLSRIINTRKYKEITVNDIKINNNKMVSMLKISIILFMVALVLVFICAITLGIVYYLF